MNERISEKCGNPIYFDSIKFAIHTLEGTLFDDTIKELLEINPYLATLCYATSEHNELLEQYITNYLSTRYTDSIYENVLICLSFSLLGLKRESYRIMRKLTKKNNGEWNKVNHYYKNLLYSVLLQYQDTWYLIKYLRTSHQTNVLEEDKQTLLNDQYLRHDYPMFFYTLEEFALYNYFANGEEKKYIKNTPLIIENLYRRKTIRYKKRYVLWEEK